MEQAEPALNAESDETLAALRSIPAPVWNLIGDAQVAHAAIGRGGTWLGSLERSFDPPLAVEDAVAFSAPYRDGLRAICLDLTSGESLWFGAHFRFAFLEAAQDAKARRAALTAEGERPPKPHVRRRGK